MVHAYWTSTYFIVISNKKIGMIHRYLMACKQMSCKFTMAALNQQFVSHTMTRTSYNRLDDDDDDDVCFILD